MVLAVLSGTLLFTSCTAKGPEPIQFHKDNCGHCKMTIADPKFSAEVITAKGRVYKFDDLNCMVNFCRENQITEEALQYFADYETPYTLTLVHQLHFVADPNLKSPMAGNIAGYSKKESADLAASKASAQSTSWEEIRNR